MSDFKIDFSSFQKEWDKIGKRKENIILINNFLKKEHIKIFYDYVEKYKDNKDFRGGKSLNQNFIKKDDIDVYNFLIEYQNKVYEEVKNYFVKKLGVKVRKAPNTPLHFIKWENGMNSVLHADCEKQDGTPVFEANFYRLNISSLIYINDNYEGGAIEFPEYDFYLKPSSGDLVIFPSNHKHLVTEVKSSNNRYTMPMWFTFDLEDLFKSDENFDAKNSIDLFKKDDEAYNSY
jgi:hypothetical protein